MAISLTTAGTAVAGSTSVAPAYPAGVAAGRVAVLTVVCKPDTATVNSPGGSWVELVNQAGGTGAQGADTGATRVARYALVLDGTETGTVTVNITSGNSSGGVIDIFEATNGFVTPATGHATYGADATHGTGVSITGAADLDLADGDYLLFAFASTSNATNNITFSSDSLTAAGSTFGTLTVHTIFRSNTGNDIAMQRMMEPVTGGPSTAAPVWTATASANTSGVGAFVRLVETTPPVTIGGTLDVTATLTADAVATHDVGTILDATATLTTAGTLTATVGATLAATATLTGAINVEVPPSGAASFRNWSYGLSGGTNSVTCSMPTGYQPDDMLIGHVFNDSTGGSITSSPSGWTLLVGPHGSGQTAWVYWKRAVASEPNATWQTAIADDTQVVISAWVDASTTADPTGVQAEGASGNTWTFPNITTTVDNSLVVALLAVDGSSGETPSFGSWTGGFAERYEFAEPTYTTAKETWQAAADWVKATAGQVTGIQVSGSQVSPEAAVLAMVALPPGGGAPPVDVAAALAVTATLTGAATLTAAVGTALSATATLTAAGDRTAPVDAALPVTATLTSSINVEGATAKQIDAALAATATLATEAAVTHPTDAALAATATLTSGALATRAVDAAVATTATLTTTAAATHAVGAAVATTATIASTTGVTFTVGGTLAVTATLSTAATTERLVTVAATLSVTATLATAGLRTVGVAALLAATSTLTAAAARLAAAEATLPAAATVTAEGTVAGIAGAAVTVTVTLVADGAVQPLVTAYPARSRAQQQPSAVSTARGG